MCFSKFVHQASICGFTVGSLATFTYGTGSAIHSHPKEHSRARMSMLGLAIIAMDIISTISQLLNHLQSPYDRRYHVQSNP